MTTKPNEHISPILSTPRLREVIESLANALTAVVGEEELQAMYGWGCRLHPELCYIPVRVGISWLDRFVQESLQQEIVVPGESDFIFIVGGDALEIEFCHEGHIHVSGTNQKLIARLLAAPEFSIPFSSGASLESDAQHLINTTHGGAR